MRLKNVNDYRKFRFVIRECTLLWQKI